MDNATIQALRELDNAFYRAHHESFSASRGGAWRGWERVARHLEPGALLDVACGNLRFERFLEERFGTGAFSFTCLDSCAELVGGHDGAEFVECDVIEALSTGGALPGDGGFDAAVSFGFMHHVPSCELRASLLRQLVESVRPGGIVAVSFWQFMCDEKLAEKARATTRQGCAELGLTLESGDCLLGWNDVPGAYRYCHDFSDSEIDELAKGVSDAADVVERFSADGRNDALNGYLMLRRR